MCTLKRIDRTIFQNVKLTISWFGANPFRYAHVILWIVKCFIENLVAEFFRLLMRIRYTSTVYTYTTCMVFSSLCCCFRFRSFSENDRAHMYEYTKHIHTHARHYWSKANVRRRGVKRNFAYVVCTRCSAHILPANATTLLSYIHTHKTCNMRKSNRFKRLTAFTKQEWEKKHEEKKFECFIFTINIYSLVLALFQQCIQKQYTRNIKMCSKTQERLLSSHRMHVHSWCRNR